MGKGERDVAFFFWAFLFYSFMGYLLEKWYAHVTHAEKQARKGLILMPLCPVYGLGMTAVLALPAAWRSGVLLILTGAVVTTVVEYAVHWAYETLLGVRFWDYSAVRGNLRGRVCLPFTLSWGMLVATAVWTFQPLLDVAVPRIPPWVTLTAMLVLTVDTVMSIRLLWLTHDTEALHLSTLREVV